MKKLLLIVSVLAIISTIVWWNFNKDVDDNSQTVDKIEVQEQNNNEVVTENSTENPEVKENKGIYTTYSPSQLKENVTNIIFFKANWCPSCRSLDKDLLDNANKIPSSLVILSADFDKETELKAKYGVTLQHTLIVVDSNGELIKKLNGLYSILTFDKLIEVLQ